MYRFVQYLLYQLRRLKYVKGRDVHSPRVFDLVECVFQVPYTYYIYRKLESRRGKLIRNRQTREQTLEWGDSPATCRLVHKLCVWRKPETLRIVGDQTGIITSYLRAAAPQAKDGGKVLDFVWLDCRAEAEAVERAFRELQLNEDSIVVVDRIRWNRQMGQAWERLCLAPQVTSSIDCYDFGILLFEHHLEKKTYFF